MAAASFAAYTAAVLVFWYGGRMVTFGQMTAGELSSFLIYTLIIAFALGGLADLWADFMRAAGAAERVFELLDRKPAIAPAGGLQPADATGAVKFSGVRFAYPTRPEVSALTASCCGNATSQRRSLRLCEPTAQPSRASTNAPGSKGAKSSGPSPRPTSLTGTW